jgi:hypothetical protein
MKVRSTPKVFDVINDLKYKNLLVGGCSFTYNISDTDSSSWPYYLRDKCGFHNVYDCSVEGASNYQILTSVMYGLETHDLNPDETLIVIMWSGYGRDSIIVPLEQKLINQPTYYYDNKTISVNTTEISKKKNKFSRALENYIYVTSLWNYLQNQKYQCIFLNFVDPTIPNRGQTFNIVDFLPNNLKKKFLNMFTDIENFYVYCLKNNQLQQDDFHPTMQGHLDWTHQVLAPSLMINPAYSK